MFRDAEVGKPEMDMKRDHGDGFGEFDESSEGASGRRSSRRVVNKAESSRRWRSEACLSNQKA